MKVEKVVNPPQNPTVRNILRLGFHQISPFEESVKQADGETTEYIDQKCSQREGRCQEILNVTRDEITQNASGKLPIPIKSKVLSIS